MWLPASHLPVHRPAGSIEPADDWPLFNEGERRTRFVYAIFALNKVCRSLPLPVLHCLLA